MSDLNIGGAVLYRGKQYMVCGLSTMVYDKDCEGEPEWKHTKEIQEVAIVEPFERDHIFVKPAWIPIAEIDEPAQPQQPEATLPTAETETR